MFSFTFVVWNVWEWKTCYGLRTLLRAHWLPHFQSMLVLCILRRWLLGVYFQPFQMHKMKVNWRVKHEVEGWNVNFHKWKGIWIYKRCLNWFPFQRRKHQGKYDCGERRRWKSWKKLGGWWNITSHCSKRRNGAWIYQKCKKIK